MVAHKSKQEKNVDGTIISISLVERLKDFPQDRLVEEVIELWDEINKLEVELAVGRKQWRSIELERKSKSKPNRALVAELDEKIRVANMKILQLGKQLENERYRNTSLESDHNKLKKLELENAKLLQNEEELLLLVLDMENYIKKLQDM